MNERRAGLEEEPDFRVKFVWLLVNHRKHRAAFNHGVAQLAVVSVNQLISSKRTRFSWHSINCRSSDTPINPRESRTRLITPSFSNIVSVGDSAIEFGRQSRSYNSWEHESIARWRQSYSFLITRCSFIFHASTSNFSPRISNSYSRNRVKPPRTNRTQPYSWIESGGPPPDRSKPSIGDNYRACAPLPALHFKSWLARWK